MKLRWKSRWMSAFLVALALFIAMPASVFAIDGVYHAPYGTDDLYDVQVTERLPRDPVAGDTVYLKLTTWPIEAGQATWITWTKNGVTQTVINGTWKYNNGNNSYWEVNMGSFSKGDAVTYTVHANKSGANEKTIGPFSFTVTGWESVASISSYTNSTNHVVLNASPNTGTMSPKINIAFQADDVFRVQLSPKGTATMATGLSNYTFADNTTYYLISTSALKIRIDKNPYKMSVYKPDGTTLIAREYDSTVNRNMAWLTDGSNIIDKVQDNLYSPTSEQFYGFGEHYNNFQKRGYDVDTYVYNQYKNQGSKTYMSIPFFVNTNGYGVYVNSTYYSKFKLATDRSDMYNFTVNTSGASTSMLDYYFVYGSNVKDVISNYSDLTYKPTMLPKWAFGLWMSANEWDRQSEVTTALSNASTNNIPATAVVLEQWSDENTFYIFNDATYTPKTGSAAFSYSDFTFGTKWPNPAQMATDIHNAGMKLVLWQVPIQKYTNYAYTQKDNDESYMISQGYAVGDGNSGQYRLPAGSWFENSLLLDFTSTSAKNWWMSKRAYLFDGVGIDGFKTDGGEMVWGRWLTFNNGKKGDEMRNQYPNDYVAAYNDYAHSKKADSVSFSRSGTSGAQKSQIFWAGDQESTFGAFRDAMHAGLTSSISGVPFWSWDLAGFTGDTYPTAELYKRSIEMAAFSPIMQFHSEKSNPSPSEERSPWNAATRTGDSTVLTTSQKFINARMNLLPYIYSEAKKTSDTGIPLMRAMVVEYPGDTSTFGLTEQYMFGDNLLVAPVVNQGETSKSVYLPAGEWTDFWWGAMRPGSQTISYYASVDDMPVFAKAGAILPMNLNSTYTVGGTIGNDLTNYTNLTFRVFPQGTTSYSWYDGTTTRTITSTEEYNLDKVTVSVPALTVTSTLQVLTKKPSSVTKDGSGLTEYSSVSSLSSASQGWYYDSAAKLAYVKISSGVSARSVVLNGVDKNAYEAEFATLNAVSTNTNHTGYLGTGFVDGFATSGDSVEFQVYAPSAATYSIDVRYSAGGGAGSRAIYKNGVKVTDLSLSATTNWDTWNTATLSTSLNAGLNTIRVQYDSGNSTGINLDNVGIRW
ncbi:TIM-barrel domain-containing protein [Cohnella silvisoli]|uniref:Glycoside hydrolase family 31 protein n=1 Tax=Cohnella silvisoli TaxID=2873699 RepID=A0ABV1KKR6_9BACL|nr:TIM-barrel domain-containing protein [Cohnella silvisoli]